MSGNEGEIRGGMGCLRQSRRSGRRFVVVLSSMYYVPFLFPLCLKEPCLEILGERGKQAGPLLTRKSSV